VELSYRNTHRAFARARNRALRLRWFGVGLFVLTACDDVHAPRRDAGADPEPAHDASEHIGTRAEPEVVGECSIAMRGPGLVATDGEGVEYCIATFEDADCTYRVEYGAGVTNPFVGMQDPSFPVEEVSIDMSTTELVTVHDQLSSGGYVLGVHVPSFDRDPPDFALTASARCSARKALDNARSVLETLDLLHVGEGPCEPVRPEKCSPL
jgi:hypothetical protein